MKLCRVGENSLSAGCFVNVKIALINPSCSGYPSSRASPTLTRASSISVFGPIPGSDHVVIVSKRGICAFLDPTEDVQLKIPIDDRPGSGGYLHMRSRWPEPCQSWRRIWRPQLGSCGDPVHSFPATLCAPFGTADRRVLRPFLRANDSRCPGVLPRSAPCSEARSFAHQLLRVHDH